MLDFRRLIRDTEQRLDMDLECLWTNWVDGRWEQSAECPLVRKGGTTLLNWIRTRRAFRAGVIAASGALSLAIATGATAYIVTDHEDSSERQAQILSGESATVTAAYLGDRIRDIEEPHTLPAVDPQDLHAADVARTLVEDEYRAREAAEAAVRQEEERTVRAAEAAQRDAEERERAEEAAEAARLQAAAGGAGAPANRAASASTPVGPTRTPAPARPAAESTVTQAMTAATGSIQQAAAAAGWPAELLAKVERVVMCESSGRTTAVSPAGYVGLMQVAPWLHGPVPADAVGQLAQAYGVYLRQGWGAWPVCGR